MLLLGTAASWLVQRSTLEGVAVTAAASVDSIISNFLEGMPVGNQMTDKDRESLDRFFEVRSSNQSSRLMQIRIQRLDGAVVYQASSDINDSPPASAVELAKTDQVVSDVVEVPLQPLGPFGVHNLSLLRLVTPLHRPDTHEVFAIAALYYSARSLVAIQFGAELGVWTAVLLTGLGVILSLYVFVTVTNQTIQRQRARLSTNLTESRRLASEVRDLHADSERLRVEAIEANEQLLARVGSDIHDGPLQLLTLIILQLSNSTAKTPDDATRAGQALQQTSTLATDAMRELRNISVGLVLPELSGLTLREALLLAISRHEGATGTRVANNIDSVDFTADSAVQVCLYRVVQEGLANAFHHSSGLAQEVRIGRVDHNIEVVISNQRANPVESSLDTGPHLGLRGMQLRVEAVGGGLKVEMGADRVVVSVRVPVARQVTRRRDRASASRSPGRAPRARPPAGSLR